VRDSIATERYLDRYIEPGLPSPPAGSRWRHVVVIPAYREPSALLERLAHLRADDGRVLAVLVLNRPDSDADDSANDELRALIGDRKIQSIGDGADLLVIDTERTTGPLPASRGVGLARKIGCDLAFSWIARGTLESRWICSTDADATLPPDYFDRLAGIAPAASAAVFPFVHEGGPDQQVNAATALYELRLHHYVLGLEYADSPYAWHALGSCLAVDAAAYAHCRGFPKRSGAEDFYLLNKLSKLGPIARPSGRCIRIDARESTRVPFGTGPAVSAILSAEPIGNAPVFDHPDTFRALKSVISVHRELGDGAQQHVRHLLRDAGLESALADASADALEAVGIDECLRHCQKYGDNPARFSRHFHAWFDAFRTLKFLHALRDAGWESQPLENLGTLQPVLWPGCTALDDRDLLLQSTAKHWGWSLQPPHTPE